MVLQKLASTKKQCCGITTQQVLFNANWNDKKNLKHLAAS